MIKAGYLSFNMRPNNPLQPDWRFKVSVGRFRTPTTHSQRASRLSGVVGRSSMHSLPSCDR